MEFSKILSYINGNLGDFCQNFAYKRKDLAKLARSPRRDVLFTLKEDSTRNWSINEGGGTEVQYGIHLNGNTLRYGLGFNAQYVPFANDKSSVDYIQPFVDAFLSIKYSQPELFNRLKEKQFSIIDGNENDLRKLKQGDYYLFGKEIKLEDDKSLSEQLDSVCYDIKNDLFDLYCNIFDLRNKIMQVTTDLNTEIAQLKKVYQLIFTGAPGTGKTYHATEVAEKMIKNARTKEEQEKITEEAKQTEEYIKAGTDEKKAKIIEKYKEKLTEAEQELFKKVQFHPGYDYSDFIIGLKPEVEGGQVTFKWKDGVFKEFADEALKAYIETNAKEEKVKPYIFIIDEINRADLSRVFGEVFSLLEEDYRFQYDENGSVLYKLKETEKAEETKEIEVKGSGTPIEIPSKDKFILPPNLYIIGTMNDIDRSVESMDFALRRRFSWKEVTANDSERIIDATKKNGENEVYKIESEKYRSVLKQAMKELNKYIGGEELPIDEKREQKVPLNLGTEYQLGGAYFLNFAKYQEENNPFESLWNNHIVIILNEYLRGRSNREQILKALKGVYDGVWK